MNTKQISGVFTGESAVSSVVEHYLDTVGVTGSNPVSRTIFAEENESFQKPDTDQTQNSVETGNRKVKFPQIIRHRKADATIYGKTPSYSRYRVSYRATGKRHLRTFETYGEARQEAERIVRDLASASQNVGLSSKDAADAIAIRDALDAFRRDTGRSLTALQSVTGYLDAAKILPSNISLADMVQGYLRTVAVVSRKLLSEAVEEFLEIRRPKAAPLPGKRPTLHPTYVNDTSRYFREFSNMFPGHAVADLSRDLLNLYATSRADLSAKSWNDRRTTLGMFIRWCSRRDYLPVNHRLLEADGLRKETTDSAPIDFYRPDELRALLDNADEEMRVVIALQAFAGLRLDETVRLDWNDVFGRPGHIEISSSKSKTRQRRLVEISPTLEQWLIPYRGMEGKVVTRWQAAKSYAQAFTKLLRSLKLPPRRNGLRHGFVTFHLAQHANEGLTSALAGNIPTVIHQHYRGLATKADAEKWFGVAPSEPAENLIQMPASA